MNWLNLSTKPWIPETVPLILFQLSTLSHACGEGAGGQRRRSSRGSGAVGCVVMRCVLLKRAAMGPPNGTYVPDVCAIDDTLQADADSLTLVHRRFPGFCPYHIVHNLLGGHYSRHPQCTASPFADVTCAHGSHSRPDDAQDQDAPALGSVVFLPLGLSYRAGCRGSLVVGCVECESYGAAMACAACRRQSVLKSNQVMKIERSVLGAMATPAWR